MTTVSPGFSYNDTLHHVMRKSMSVTIAPWLDRKSMATTCDVRCSVCTQSDEFEHKAKLDVDPGTKQGWDDIMGVRIARSGLRKTWLSTYETLTV